MTIKKGNLPRKTLHRGYILPFLLKRQKNEPERLYESVSGSFYQN